MSEVLQSDSGGTRDDRICHRTWSLLAGVFPERGPAERWLDRPNKALGNTPRHLIAAGRGREVQTYLETLLTPVEVPPEPFESLFTGTDPAPR